MMNTSFLKSNMPPRINSPKIFGIRPGSPFLFKVAASGSGTMCYQAKDLPKGLSLDEKTGIISGTIYEGTGTFQVKFLVSNSIACAEQDFQIISGEHICLTPPMGWNSWYCYSESISEKAVRETADAMVEKGLINHGWTYINIDDCWQGERGGKYGAIQPNDRFEDMKGMCDYVHSLGLKIGIYSTPWIGTYSGFLGGSEPINKQDLTDKYLSEKDRLQYFQFFGRYPGTLDRKADFVGENWLFDCDVRQWVEWGIDYVKVDWAPNDIPTTKRIYNHLYDCGRDIVLSLSNTAPFKNANDLSKYANCWRTTGDIHDNWISISEIAFSQAKWQPYGKPGHWNDPDMLQIGNLGVPNKNNDSFYPSKLTSDEQYTQLSMWCLLSAPLIVSCQLESLDDFTLKLLTNDEVISVNQDSAGLQAEKNVEYEDVQVWTKPLSDGALAIGVFNLSNTSKKINLKSYLKLEADSILRDLWRGEDINTSKQNEVNLNAHGVLLYKKSIT